MYLISLQRSSFSLAALLLAVPLSFCNGQTRSAKAVSPGRERPRVLIVVLSRTGNTKAVADMIQTKVGGDMVVLKLVTPYPADYRRQVDQVVKENETGFLPPLATKIDSMFRYDAVFVGFPTWGMKLPPPIKTFLKSYDLHGKTVIPFNTNAGYGIGNSIDTFTRLCEGCQVLNAFSTKGGVERDGIFLAIEGSRKKEVNDEVSKWIDSLHLSEVYDKK